MRAWYFSASLPPMALRSMPAQNVPPAPVRMAQRMSSLPSISSQASFMPTSMGRLSAFFASGRFMVTMAVAPSRSNVRCSVVTTVPSRGRRRNEWSDVGAAVRADAAYSRSMMVPVASAPPQHIDTSP